jgi:hypothetical protein
VPLGFFELGRRKHRHDLQCLRRDAQFGQPAHVHFKRQCRAKGMIF